MIVYSYLIEHDLGLAPNPFGGYCTLAVCKPIIRKSSKLKIGDWIIGTASKSLEDTIKRRGLTNKLIYAMQVTERITLNEYWNDKRFQYKKPIMHGTLVRMFGDNFYHQDKDGNWIQEDSAHSNSDGTCNLSHLKKDTGGNNALISNYFYYFGEKAPTIPNNLKEVCHTAIGQKKLSEQLGNEVIQWITSNFQTGIHGDPLNWSEYNQLRLSI